MVIKKPLLPLDTFESKEIPSVLPCRGPAGQDQAMQQDQPVG